MNLLSICKFPCICKYDIKKNSLIVWCFIFKFIVFYKNYLSYNMFYFISVIVKGSSVSNYYRFIGKNCQWVWMQTRATIIYNTSNVPQYIVCMNYIIRSVGQSILFIKSYNNYSLLLL